MRDFSRVTIVAGIYRSASTWAFNAAQQLVANRSAVQSAYCDDAATFATLACGEGPIVLKSHYPSRTLVNLAARHGAKVVLTIRDPLDAVVSGMQQFDWSFEHALERVGDSSSACLALARALSPFLIRYEDPSCQSQSGLEMLATFLAIDATPDDLAEIGRSLAPRSVEATIRGWVDDGHFRAGVAADMQFDPKTQWHPNHVGDGRVGKYADVLTQEQIAIGRTATRRFGCAFGYDRSPLQSVADAVKRVVPWS